MSVNTLLGIALVVSVILFFAAARFTRADRGRALRALVGGALASAVGLVLDICGTWAGLWYYQGDYTTHGPWIVYVAVMFAEGALAMIGWYLAGRFGNAALAVFVLVVAAGLTIQDYLIANSPFRVQIISPGIAPAVCDLLLWAVVTAVGLGTLRALSGPAKAG